jgi:hypothetical protein
VIRSLISVLTFLTAALFFVQVEQKRTEAELDNVLSAYLSDGILHDAHDWGSGRDILVVWQREAQGPGMWRIRWFYPFDKRLKFSEASVLTSGSFTLSNAIPHKHHLMLSLPAGVKAVAASRDGLEGSAASAGAADTC